MKQGTAIVLMNLGGPDRLESVRPFLFNLFNDPAIIDLPNPFRWLLAGLISWRRASKARAIYAKLGGASPLLANSVAQALALSRAYKDTEGSKVFVVMRYWHPMAPVTVRAVKDMNPARVVLIPLYPQYSGATSGSSYKAWMEEAKRQGLDCPHHFVCCYADDGGFVDAVGELLQEAMKEATAKASTAKPLVIFSAHGLPKKKIDGGDPYQAQIELSANAVVASLQLKPDEWIIAYQSRVGPLEWIGPNTDDVIADAARDGRAIIVVPIAFVSEHSETLVELDIDYRNLAEGLSAPAYVRVPTVGTHPKFIEGLARLARNALEKSSVIGPGASSTACRGQRACPCRVAKGADG